MIADDSYGFARLLPPGAHGVLLPAASCLGSYDSQTQAMRFILLFLVSPRCADVVKNMASLI